MTIEELDKLMEKLRSGIFYMGDVEFCYASDLYAAAKRYRDAQVAIRDGQVNTDNRPRRENNSG